MEISSSENLEIAPVPLESSHGDPSLHTAPWDTRTIELQNFYEHLHRKKPSAEKGRTHSELVAGILEELKWPLIKELTALGEPCPLVFIRHTFQVPHNGDPGHVSDHLVHIYLPTLDITMVIFIEDKCWFTLRYDANTGLMKTQVIARDAGAPPGAVKLVVMATFGLIPEASRRMLEKARWNLINAPEPTMDENLPEQYIELRAELRQFIWQTVRTKLQGLYLLRLKKRLSELSKKLKKRLSKLYGSLSDGARSLFRRAKGVTARIMVEERTFLIARANEMVC